MGGAFVAQPRANTQPSAARDDAWDERARKSARAGEGTTSEVWIVDAIRGRYRAPSMDGKLLFRTTLLWDPSSADATEIEICNEGGGPVYARRTR